MRHHFFVKPSPPYAEPVLRPLRDLKPDEQAQVARNKASVYAHLPEAVPFIKELHEAGMIDGWRGVVSVDVHPSTGSGRTDIFEEVEHGTA